MWIYTFIGCIIFKIRRILKPLKMVLRKIWIQIFIFICCIIIQAVMVIHRATMWQFDLNKKLSWEGFLGGGGKKYFKYLFLNEYAKLYSKISVRVFLNDYILTCKISTLRTLTLSYVLVTSHVPHLYKARVWLVVLSKTRYQKYC